MERSPTSSSRLCPTSMRWEVSDMPDETFDAIQAALQVVQRFGTRLARGDAEGHVCRSVDDLALVVNRREHIEVAIYRLLNSIRELENASSDGRRRAFQREAASRERLIDAVQEQLMPALTRGGYPV